MNANLYIIEQTLEDLMDQGAQAELDGDHEAAAVFYQQLQEYLTREAAKVTSYVGLIRSREATVAAAKLERDRIDGIMKRAQADVDRLKANALATMQHFDVKELKATPGGGLRRQNNGSVEPLDIPDWPKDSQGDLKLVLIDDVPSPLDLLPLKIYAVPDSTQIRMKLKQSVMCPQCKDIPYTYETEDGKCPTCHGEGTIPATVPGARLLERGEHIRVV